MPRPSVFISHSGDSGHVKRIVERLEEDLRASGFEPLIYWRTTKGTNYKPPLDEFIETCDAAVFVISPRALMPEHTWVRDEANQLTLKRNKPGFQGIPVLIEGVTPKDLGESWEAANVRAEHAIVAKDPLAIANQVIDALAPTRDRLRATPEVAQRLEEELGAIRDDALRRAARPLRGGYLPIPVSLHMALRLMQATQEEVVEVAMALTRSSRDAAELVLNLALPFTWVDPDAARALDSAVRGSRPAALNARRKRYTTRCYVICGSDENDPWPVREVPFLQGEYLPELDDDAAREQAWNEGDIECEPARSEQPIAPVVLAIECPRLSEEIVKRFEARYRDKAGVGIVFVAHGQHWESIPQEIADRVTLLTPELEPAREEQAFQAYTEGWRLVQNKRASNDYYRSGFLA